LAALPVALTSVIPLFVVAFMSVAFIVVAFMVPAFIVAAFVAAFVAATLLALLLLPQAVSVASAAAVRVIRVFIVASLQLVDRRHSERRGKNVPCPSSESRFNKFVGKESADR